MLSLGLRVSQPTSVHGVSCLHGGKPRAAIKERSREGISSASLDFTCHVGEGIIGHLPFARSCGRPFSYFKPIHNKVYSISLNFIDEINWNPLTIRASSWTAHQGWLTAMCKALFTPSCFPYGIKASCQSCRNPAVTAQKDMSLSHVAGTTVTAPSCQWPRAMQPWGSTTLPTSPTHQWAERLTMF